MSPTQYIAKHNTFISLGLVITIAVAIFYAGVTMATVQATLKNQNEDLIEIKADTKSNGVKIELVHDMSKSQHFDIEEIKGWQKSINGQLNTNKELKDVILSDMKVIKNHIEKE